jgi:Uma2 family endonuclease
MTVSEQILTADDLLTMPSDVRCELVRGELVDMPPPGFEHGSIISEIAFLFTTHVKAKRLGRVLGAETGFRLSRNPDTVRGIDVAFVSTARIPTHNLEKHFDGAPDLAVEVLSPSDSMTMMEDKVDELLRAGARAVWVVNPVRRTVTIHRAGAQPHVLRETDTLDAGDAMPGFTCVVKDFFA